ncbi:MAG: hypothetical protein PHP37_00265 [Patescibacteria group bacterium]|nr:hypothetical protein [Patescibacteria group bacterium]
MKKTKTLIINNEKVFILLQFLTLLSIATIAPMIGNQLITGSIVNAILFITVMLLGVRAGILISIIPSFVALFSGIISITLIPIIPIVILGNILLILCFNFLKEKKYWIKIFFSSLLKFIFIFSFSNLFLNLILKREIIQKLIVNMGYFQLLTALSGGILAFFIVKFINKGKIS